MQKKLAVSIILCLCAVILGFLGEVTLAASVETVVTLEKGTITIIFSTEDNIINLNYTSFDESHQLSLTSDERIELFIEGIWLFVEVCEAELKYTLRFPAEKSCTLTDQPGEGSIVTTVTEEPGYQDLMGIDLTAFNLTEGVVFPQVRIGSRGER